MMPVSGNVRSASCKVGKRLKRTGQTSPVLAGRVQHQRVHEDDIALPARHLVEAAVIGLFDQVEVELQVARLVRVGPTRHHARRDPLRVVEQVLADPRRPFVADPRRAAVRLDITPAGNYEEGLLW